MGKRGCDGYREEAEDREIDVFVIGRDPKWILGQYNAVKKVGFGGDFL